MYFHEPQATRFFGGAICLKGLAPWRTSATGQMVARIHSNGDAIVYTISTDNIIIAEQKTISSCLRFGPFKTKMILTRENFLDTFIALETICANRENYIHNHHKL